MSDLVVTVPRDLWPGWLAEGLLPGDPEGADLFAFHLGNGPRPPIAPGDRVYIVAWDRLRGYAPLVRLDAGSDGWTLIRGSGAVAVTIEEKIRGFRNFRERWWDRAAERPFPDWMTEGIESKPKRHEPSVATSSRTTSSTEEKPGQLSDYDKRLLAQGKVSTAHGAYQVDPRPWGNYVAGNCLVCRAPRPPGHEAPKHHHRFDTQCPHCGAGKVFPGNRSRTPDEAFCMGCGRWWSAPELYAARAP